MATFLQITFAATLFTKILLMMFWAKQTNHVIQNI